MTHSRLDVKVMIGLIALAFALTLPFLSRGLDDFDSVSFAQGVRTYDLRLQNPHAPGFPLYILVARGVDTLIQDIPRTLTLLSAVGNALAVVSLFVVGTHFASPVLGIIGAVWLMLLPSWWVHSGIALSDVLGLALPMGASALWVMSLREGVRWSFWAGLGGFLAGVSLGVRPHNALILAVMGVWWLFELRRLNRLHGLMWGIFGAVIGVMVWAVPLFSATGGLEGYITILSQHSQHVLNSDSLLNQPITVESLTRRLAHFLQGMVSLWGGGERWAIAWGVFAGVGLVGLWRIAPTQRKGIWVLIAWFAVTLLKLFLLESLERPRLFFPFVPPLLLLVAWGWMGWHDALQGKWRLGIWGVVLGATGVLLVRGLPLVQGLSREYSAPEQAVTFVRETYPPEKTVLVALGSFRHVQWGLVQWKLYPYDLLYMTEYNAETLTQAIADRAPRRVIFFDADDISADVTRALAETLAFVPVKDRTFERTPDVFPQHATVRVQVLIPLEDIQPADLTLPEDGVLWVGNDAYSKYFGVGWYRGEKMGDVLGRWTDQEAVLRVHLPVQETRLTFNYAPFMGGQSLTVRVNEVSLDPVPLNVVWGTHTLTIPADLITKDGITTIVFEHELAEFPPNHNRRIAAGYEYLRFETVEPSADE